MRCVAVASKVVMKVGVSKGGVMESWPPEILSVCNRTEGEAEVLPDRRQLEPAFVDFEAYWENLGWSKARRTEKPTMSDDRETC